MNDNRPAALLLPFAAVRPRDDMAPSVVARPYDVISFDEAKAGAEAKPWSFLHVSRAEIDLPPGTDAHAPEVYQQAAHAFQAMQDAGVLIREEAPCYYAYRMIAADGHTQTGVAAAGSVEAYRANRIRRHEHTRPDKEFDRTLQIEAVGAHTGPVLACYRPDQAIAQVLEAATAAEPIADARTDEGTRHIVWRIAEPEALATLTQQFEAMPAIWIADGHHRSAAAGRVAERRAAAGLPCNGRFLVISFPSDQMRILDYNRVVRDLQQPQDAFLAALDKVCTIEPAPGAFSPERPGVFGMVLDGGWYRLTLRHPPEPAASPVTRLDVSLLQERVLAPLLGIGDPRTDTRIDFIGGGRGLGALEERVNSGQWAVAFAMHPTRLDELMAVADADEVMPPKSTWFEPKLADGLLSLPIA